VRNSFWDSGAASGHERFGCASPIEHNDLPARLGDCLRSCRTIRGAGSAGFIAALMSVIAAPSGFPMGEPTLDRRFHRKLETEGLTLKKVLLLVVLSLGVACAVGVVDQLQRFGAQSDNSPPSLLPWPSNGSSRSSLIALPQAPVLRSMRLAHERGGPLSVLSKIDRRGRHQHPPVPAETMIMPLSVRQRMILISRCPRFVFGRCSVSDS